jgi:glycosyltransferase involved in cell wall biosynthesis
VNQLYDVIKYLNHEQCEVYLITLSPEPDNSRWIDYEKLGVHLYTLNHSRIKWLLFAKKHIQILINIIKPDIIHSQGIRSDIISSQLDKENPRISTIHNLLQFDYRMEYGKLKSKIMLFQHINALKKISLCIGVSRSVSDNLHHICDNIDILTIENGIDTALYNPVSQEEKMALRKKLNLPLDGNLWISSGNLSTRKNPLFLIDCWKEHIKHDNHLLFIGDGILLEECIEKIKNHNNIHVLGRVNNVVDYLNASDYFISSSWAEGFPLAVLEAMACGLPVLLSDIEPHKEIMNLARDAGFLFKLTNEKEFIEMTNKMATADRKIMSNAALKIIQDKLNALSMSEAYQDIYRHLVGNRE